MVSFKVLVIVDYISLLVVVTMFKLLRFFTINSKLIIVLILFGLTLFPILALGKKKIKIPDLSTALNPVKLLVLFFGIIMIFYYLYKYHLTNYYAFYIVTLALFYTQILLFGILYLKDSYRLIIF